MAAGFLITRVVLVCLLSDMTYSSVLPAANLGDPKTLEDGQKKGPRGFGTRRPLHYIRALRQPSKRTQVKDLSHSQVQKQIPSPYQPQMSPIQSPPQRKYTTPKPRTFALSLDVPVFNLLNQNKQTGSTTGANSKYSASFPIPNIFLENRGSTKDSNKEMNGNGEVKPNFHFSFSLPSQKPSQNTDNYLDLNPQNLDFQKKLPESEKQLDSTQTGLKWLFNQAGGHEQAQWPMALNLPILNKLLDITRNQQTQPNEHTQPTDGKLTLSSWPFSQPSHSQRLSQDKPNRQSWALQKPATNEPASPMLQKNPDPDDLYNAHTSFPRQDHEGPNVQPNPTRLPSLPQQFNRVPSKGSHFHVDGKSGIDPNARPNGESESSLQIHSSKHPKKDPKGGKPGYGSSRSNFQLSLSVPIPAKSPNITKISGSHSGIKFGSGSDGSGYRNPVLQLGSGQIESNWPDSNFDSVHQQTDLKWPVLNLDAGRQHAQQIYEHVPSKPTDRRTHSPWHSHRHANSQNIQDELGQNWLFQGPSVTKPPSPVLSLPRYTYSVATSPGKLEDQSARDPSQEAGFYHSSWIKPSSEDDFQRLTGHSDVKPLATEHEYSQLKPSIGHTESIETRHHWRSPQSSFTYDTPIDSLDWIGETNYELGKPQKGQKHPSYQYSSERAYQHQDTSDLVPNSVTFTPGYQSQKILGQDADGHLVDGKGKFAKLFINVESGDGGIDGQTYFTTQKVNEYPAKWMGKNMAEVDINSNPYVNLQVSIKKKSPKRPHNVPYGDETKSHVQIPCLDGVGECSPKSEKQWQTYNFPEQLNYSPFAEATAVSVPRRPFQQALSESSSQPSRNALGVKQYLGKPKHPTY